jgi:hypothetical protein
MGFASNLPSRVSTRDNFKWGQLVKALEESTISGERGTLFSVGPVSEKWRYEKSLCRTILKEQSAFPFSRY